MSTPKTITYSLRVEFGDCDPAGIVWFPNFFRWIDAASRNFFVQCGVPPWRDLEQEIGIAGTPLVDTKARFLKTASYGDELQFDVSISEWRRKSFVQRYGCRRGDTPIMECEEVRIFGGKREDGTWFAWEIPERIRALCE